MKYQKSTKILSEAGEPTDPSRRRFLKTAGAAAASAAMPGELKNLANTATQIGNQSAAPSTKESHSDRIKKLLQAALDHYSEYRNMFLGDREWAELDKKSQKYYGTFPWGTDYVVNSSFKLRELFIHTNDPGPVGKETGDFGKLSDQTVEVYIFMKNGIPQIFKFITDDKNQEVYEVIAYDSRQEKIIIDWLNNLDLSETEFINEYVGALIDILISDSHTPSKTNQSTSSEPTGNIDPVKAASNISPVNVASNLAGLDRIKNLVKKLLQTDQPQTQPQTSAEKPAVPALPAPDKTQAEIMAQLRDIIDRDLTQSEKELVKREVEQEKEKLKKPPDESHG